MISLEVSAVEYSGVDYRSERFQVPTCLRMKVANF